MKLSTFLLGGLAGAAAVVYFTNRSKPMLFSALSSSDAVGNLLQDKNVKSKRSSAKAAPSHAAANGLEEVVSSVSGLGKVEDIVNRDPQLKATVDEILASSSSRGAAEQHTH